MNQSQILQRFQSIDASLRQFLLSSANTDNYYLVNPFNFELADLQTDKLPSLGYGSFAKVFLVYVPNSSTYRSLKMYDDEGICQEEASVIHNAMQDASFAQISHSIHQPSSQSSTTSF